MSQLGNYPLVRSARISRVANVKNAALWVVTAQGNVLFWPAGGILQDCPLPAGWFATSVFVAGNGTAWIRSSSEDSTYALWCRPHGNPHWTLKAVVDPSSVVAGEVHGGLWVVVGREMRQVDQVACDANTIKLGFNAIQVSQGADGTIWALGGAKRFGGTSVSRYDPIGQKWLSLPAPAAAIRISAAPDGTAWTVNSRGQVWRLHPDGAGHFAECNMNGVCRNCLYSEFEVPVRDVSVGPDGNVWILMAAVAKHGFAISYIVDFSSKRAKVAEIPVGAVSIAATVSSPCGPGDAGKYGFRVSA